MVFLYFSMIFGGCFLTHQTIEVPMESSLGAVNAPRDAVNARKARPGPRERQRMRREAEVGGISGWVFSIFFGASKVIFYDKNHDYIIIVVLVWLCMYIFLYIQKKKIYIYIHTYTYFTVYIYIHTRNIHIIIFYRLPEELTVGIGLNMAHYYSLRMILRPFGWMLVLTLRLGPFLMIRNPLNIVSPWGLNAGFTVLNAVWTFQCFGGLRRQ